MRHRPGTRNLSRSGVTGCTLRAFLRGFRSGSATITAGPVQEMDIVLHLDEGSTGVVISPTLWTAPKEARDSFKEASDALLSSGSDPTRASDKLHHAVEIDAQYAQAWIQLAVIQEATDSDAARASYIKSLLQRTPHTFFPTNRSCDWQPGRPHGRRSWNSPLIS